VFEHGGHLCNLTEEHVYNLQVADFCARVDGDSRTQEALAANRLL
jgi:hypothetical protein